MSTPPQPHPQHKSALVLSGGGAYGAFAVGIMKVLFAGRSPATEYQPLDANIFAGTSVGAFNAAVMVGDTAHDVIAGRAAGMATIGVTYGFNPQAVIDAKPDWTIATIAELPGVLGIA